MSRTNQHGRASEAGFTLLEMLVVLAILALVMGFAGPLLRGRSDGVRLETASNELAAALRLTRSGAIMRNQEATLMIDVDRRVFGSSVVPQRPFAADIDAKLTYAAGIRSAASDGGFKFFPDGSSTGGDVTLSLHGKQAKLCIDWLTGEVRRGESCRI